MGSGFPKLNGFGGVTADQQPIAEKRIRISELIIFSYYLSFLDFGRLKT